MSKITTIESFLNLMWDDYCAMNPQAQKIHASFVALGEDVQNDHIALRTFTHPKLGIKSLAKHFEKFGYVDSGEYFFVEKKLYAKHYENVKNPSLPKIFISELELDKMSPFVQATLNRAAESIPEEKTNSPEFVFNGKYWETSHEIYNKLALESEYASWVYAFGFRPNHFTVNINALKKFNAVTEINDFIKDKGFKLNASGGEIKGTPEDLLEQSSTMANQIEVQFQDGKFNIPSCYYEFAKRYKMPNGNYYQGFVAKSADKIFESTNKI